MLANCYHKPLAKINYFSHQEIQGRCHLSGTAVFSIVCYIGAPIDGNPGEVSKTSWLSKTSKLGEVEILRHFHWRSLEIVLPTSSHGHTIMQGCLKDIVPNFVPSVGEYVCLWLAGIFFFFATVYPTNPEILVIAFASYLRQTYAFPSETTYSPFLLLYGMPYTVKSRISGRCSVLLVRTSSVFLYFNSYELADSIL